MEPLVSIVMPNYNGGAYIGDTIRSVLNQTYSNFEFIIVDDASTDDSREIISSFDDKRIYLAAKEKNEHICMGLNTGIGIAKGSYIARIDSDDKWKPEKLKKQVEFLENHPEYGACFTWADIIDENGNKVNNNPFYDIFKQKNRTREEWIKSLFFGDNCLCHPSVVVRASLVDKLNGYRNSLLQLQDYDMWLRLLQITSIYVLEEELTEYRRINEDNQSISAKSEDNDTRCYNETVYIMNDYLENMDNELFISCFRDDFVNKDSKSEQELVCEKAFLLCCTEKRVAGRENGLRKLAELLDNREYRTVLEDKFNFTSKDFYNLNKEHYYYDYVLKDNNSVDVFETPAIYYKLTEDDNFVMVSQKVHLRDGVLQCSFDIPADACTVRFDPVDNKVCIISELRITSGNKDLRYEPVNGYIIDDVWFFATKDPQINIIDYSEINGEIKIEAKIFSGSSDAFMNSLKIIEGLSVKEKVYKEQIHVLENQAVNHMDMIAAKDNHIFNIENILAAKDTEINAKEQHISNLEQHIKNLEQTIAEMEGTKVWKLYRSIKKS